MFTTLKIDSNQLEVGMYVAQLDRPWLETPFLFQGFYIRSQDEITELQKYCKNVFVHRESIPEDSKLNPRSRARPDDEKVKSESRKTSRFSLRNLFRPSEPPESDDQFARTGTFYHDSATLKEELQTASGVHEEAVNTVHDVMNQLSNSENLDVPRLRTAVTPMVNSILRNPAALACLVRMQKKGSYIYRHSLASSVWATILGRHIGLSRDDLNVIALGAMLLDVGKTRIPDGILQKPQELSDTEAKLMRRHVEFGLDILHESKDVDPRVIEMVAYHHERYNGTGYPKGLKGSELPVFGRIAGVVDAYDAMITPRPYAEPMSSYDALRQLRVLADVEFQAEIIDQFTQAIGVFPTGTLVELNTGDVAVVTRQNKIRRLRPEVMIIMDSDKKLLESFKVMDLNSESVTDNGMHSLWIERGLPPGSFGIDPTELYLD
ncbi:MAG: HD-GYP domain-containing protein [Gammaproteobacteria bacterium]|nr:HD-GYP domain-containing protein [Gammaproteobacteria bacterium]MDH5214111.1 HD-GYP domain-containing protein [Gammaproteobacteria bacterium]